MRSFADAVGWDISERKATTVFCSLMYSRKNTGFLPLQVSRSLRQLASLYAHEMARYEAAEALYVRAIKIGSYVFSDLTSETVKTHSV